MSEKYNKLSYGIEPVNSVFHLRARTVVQDNSFSKVLSNKDLLYSIIVNDGLHVSRENTFEEVFFFERIIDVVCTLESGVVFLAEDGFLYNYDAGNNEAEKILTEPPGTCYHRNQNREGDFIIMVGAIEIESDSFWGEEEQFIYKYNKSPFKLDWKIAAPKDEIYNFVINEKKGVFYAVDSDASVYCFSLENGDRIWDVDFSQHIGDVSRTLNMHPALIGNAIVIIYRGIVLALSAENGELLWQRKGITTPWGIISNDGVIYLLETLAVNGVKKQHLVSIDGDSGELIAAHVISADEHPDFIEDIRFMNPLDWVISKTHIIIGWSDGFITAINQKNGHIDWLEDVGNGNKDAVVPGMLLSNNRLYCRTIRSDIEDRVSTSWVFEGEGGFIVD